MISNEHGFNFIEIPYSGSDLFLESFRESNRDLKTSDTLLNDKIEYYNLCIIKNPYHRAVSLYKNGMQLRKEHNLKSQNFSTYFENILNNWGTVVHSDKFNSQFHYIKKYKDIDIFKYEDLLKDWQEINKYLIETGLNPIRYYADSSIIRKWKDFYSEKESVEIVNYIFEDDFENLGYTKL